MVCVPGEKLRSDSRRSQFMLPHDEWHQRRPEISALPRPPATVMVVPDSLPAARFSRPREHVGKGSHRRSAPKILHP